ncbi:MAG TPA: hypothetical protein VFB99_24450 [Vicinamibacterales bacterium]|nr:hypothetical protein [Vicinamibacterales bacterium]
MNNTSDRHPANNGKVMLTAWVAPDLRDYVRSEAKRAGVSMSALVERFGRDWGAKQDVEAAAMAGPCLIREKVVVYRCPFCRKSWRAQGKKRAERHLTHCFERPDRMPYLGELAHPFMHEDAPWWPGAGKIWDGKQWQPVPGYMDGGGDYGARWPDLGGEGLDRVVPWKRRLEILDYDMDRYGHWDDEDIIRAIHRSTS